jgi:Ca-activated chloride channel homolog
MERCAELRTANDADQVALRGVKITGQIQGLGLVACVEQVFLNLEAKAIEAVYTFPLPEGAAVCGFEVITNDHVLTGKVDEAEKAIADYQKAIDQGDAAFAMEQHRPDVFSVRVGNLQPKQSATIRIFYVQELRVADRKIRVALPTTIAPRYAPMADSAQAMFDADALNPPHALQVPYGFTLELDVELGQRVKAVGSPSHGVRLENRDAGPRLSLAVGLGEMDRDLVVEIELAQEQVPIAIGGTGSQGDRFAAITFVPDFSDDTQQEPTPNETIFLLDCSGSMQGRSIEQAKRALALCLRSLQIGDTFNVCRFGSTFRAISAESMAYSEQTLQESLAYISTIQADLGGTEIHAPLESIMRVPMPPDKVRTVIVLTDGEVTNEPAVIALARKHRAHNRIFSFGIGAASSAFLVNGLARATGGAAEFVGFNEAIEEKVLRTFARIGSPVVSEVRIDWDGTPVESSPSEIPAIFDGDAVVIYARSSGPLPRQVKLSCKTPAGARCWKLAIPERAGTTAREFAGRNIVETLWACQRITDLADIPESVSKMIAISKEFGILCDKTTFIAVEHRSEAERNEGQPELRRIPIALAQGWGGAAAGGTIMFSKGPLLLNSLHSAAACLLDEVVLAKEVSASVPPPRRSRYKGAVDLDNALSRRGTAPSQPVGDEPLQRLLSMQSAEGWFDWHPSFDGPINGKAWNAADSRRKVEAHVAQVAISSAQVAERAVNTLLALALLREAFKEKEDFWKRAAAKAVRWLKSLGINDEIRTNH